MPPTRTTADPAVESHRQRLLPLTRSDHLRLIDAARLELDGVSDRAIANVRTLLTALEYCTGRDGCHPYRETIAHKMGRVSTRTVTRAIATAQALGILTVAPQVDRSGQHSNEYRIEWETLARLCKQQPPLRLDTVSSPLDTVSSPYKENNLLNLKLLQSPPSPEATDWVVVVEELRSVGVIDRDGTCDAASSAGLCPEDVLRIVGHWRDRPAAWSVAQLVYRVKHAAGIDEKAGWPPPDALWERRAAKDTRDARIARDAARDALSRQSESERIREVEAERAKAADIAQRFGPQLDRMTRAEIGDLLELHDRPDLAKTVATLGVRAARPDLLELLDEVSR